MDKQASSFIEQIFIILNNYIIKFHYYYVTMLSYTHTHTPIFFIRAVYGASLHEGGGSCFCSASHCSTVLPEGLAPVAAVAEWSGLWLATAPAVKVGGPAALFEQPSLLPGTTLLLHLELPTPGRTARNGSAHGACALHYSMRDN